MRMSQIQQEIVVRASVQYSDVNGICTCRLKTKHLQQNFNTITQQITTRSLLPPGLCLVPCWHLINDCRHVKLIVLGVLHWLRLLAAWLLDLCRMHSWPFCNGRDQRAWRHLPSHDLQRLCSRVRHNAEHCDLLFNNILEFSPILESMRFDL